MSNILTQADIQTELEKAQKRIVELEGKLASESEERFASIFRVSPAQMALTDTNTGQYIEVNEAFLRSLRLHRDEVIGKTALDLNLFARPEKRTELLQRMVAQGYLRDEYVLVRTKIGELRHGIFSAEYIYADGRKLLLTVMNDITEKMQSEERWQFALDGAGDGVWDVNLQTNQVYYSRQWKFMLGYSEDEIGETMEEWTDRIHPEDMPRVLDKMDQHVRSKTGLYSSEYRICCKDGVYKWMLSRGKVTEWTEDGRPVRVIGTHKDISDRKAAEETLWTSEARYRTLVESLDVSLSRWLPDTTLTFANEKYRQIVGFQDDVVGKMWLNFLPAESRAEAAAVNAELVCHARKVTYERSVKMPDGEIRKYQWIDTPILGGKGNAIEFQSVGIDITERKQAEEELGLLEKRSRALIEHAVDGIVLVGVDGKFKYASPSATRIFGYTQEEVISGDPDRLTHPDDLSRVMRELTIVLTSPSYVPTLQYRFRHKNGDWRWIESTFSNLLSLPSVEAIIINFHDIHERKLAEEALNKSESLLLEAQRIGRIGHMEWNGREQGLICSRELYEILDLPIGSEITQFTLANMMDPDERDRVKGLDYLAFHKKADLDYEFQIQMKDGSIRWLHQIGKVTYAENGTPRRMMAVIQDVTERKRSEGALRASEEKYRLLAEALEERVSQRTAEVQDLYDNAPTGYHSLDGDGRYVAVNQTELDWMGYRRAEVLGHSFIDFVTPNSVSRFEQAFRLLKSNGKISDIEFEIVRKNGTCFPVLLNAAAIWDGQGNYLRSRSTMFNNTQRKKAENDLRASEVQNRLLFEESPVAITLSDKTGVILQANHAYEKLTGLSRASIYGKTSEQLGLVDQTVVANLIKVVRDSISKNENFAVVEFPMTSADGVQRTVESRIYRLMINEVEHTLVTTIDISMHKKAEEALRHANFELERAMRMKDEFLANMSHELRTPLSGILGLTEALQLQIYGPLDDKQLRALKNIDSSGHHLLSLINDILDLSKIEVGKLEIFLEPVEVYDICQASLAFVREPARKKNLSLKFEVDPLAAVVMADMRRLKQILVNLLSNAVKFTPANGEVTLAVHASTAQNSLEFSVIDTGIGIERQDLERLFSPFTQVDSSLTRRFEGTGLGLALVKELAELHGGSVQVKSEVGRGSTFTVSIPWQPDPGARQMLLNFDTVGRVQKDILGMPKKSKKILLADDVEANYFPIGDYLESIGYEMIFALNGQEAIEKVRVCSPDMVLMDVQMPIMDGLEATRQLRTEQRFADLPIIVLTAMAMNGDEERCLEAGATGYISKPVGLKELAEIIRKLLAEPGQ